jgi:arabinose-5-phosphate isomerase
LHPGGSLGRRFLRVADVMHGSDELPLVSPNTTMGEAILVMSEKSFGCVGIIGDDGRLSGIITDGDLRRNMSDDLPKRLAKDIMTADPSTVRPEALAAEALGVMEEKPNRPVLCLFVIEDDRPVGLIHIHDIIRAGVA